VSDSPSITPPRRRVGVICCGVLEWRFDLAAKQSVNEVTVVTLPAGLHADPARLRADLQDAIDRMEEELKPDAIAIGYGLCGRGVARIVARRAPLAIVRAEDCTAILLGSQRRYREEFMRHPGTFYYSHGWVYARGKGGFGTPRNQSLYGPRGGDLAQRYGDEAAAWIEEFRQSWKRNYDRAAAILFPDDPETRSHAKQAQDMARELGWSYEEINGDEKLFQDLVDGRWERPEILVVRPGEVIAPAPGVEVLAAGKDLDAAYRKALARFKPRGAAAAPKRHGLGLGIDAGGTYTDAVIYDFASRKVVSKSKSPTTHGNLIEGVKRSVAGLDQESLRRVERVALSTTLATNAIVEGKGQEVGVLLMGVDAADLERLPFGRKRLVPGRMSMEGVELAPLDLAAAAEAARELKAEGARALAVSGYAAIVDPRHEAEVAAAAREATGLPVVCGHELSRGLDLYRRAVTAALNARLLPLIQSLTRSVKAALAEMGLAQAPLMVMCGDGTQMLDAYAETRPVEQILSGPAASVIGALELSGLKDAVVADMGGTTLDVAVARNGEPDLDPEGARVGRFQTCVRAMRIHTSGLGCDSQIRFAAWPSLSVGPRRVVPLAMLADQWPSVLEHLRRMAASEPRAWPGVEPADFVAPGAGADLDASEFEREILDVLKDGPLPLDEMARRTGALSPSLLPLERLETAGAVFRAGVTPTDLLHVEGKYTRFSVTAAKLALGLIGEWLGAAVEEIGRAVRLVISKGIATETLRAALAGEAGWAPEERSARFVVDSLFAKPDGRPRIHASLGRPLAPIGAPVHAFFPGLAGPLGTEVVIPDHAEVANAVGAIAADVVLSEQVEIVAAADGAFHVQSRLRSDKLFKFEEALALAEKLIRAALDDKARLNHVARPVVEISAKESAPQTNLGPVFLGVTLTGRVRG